MNDTFAQRSPWVDRGESEHSPVCCLYETVEAQACVATMSLLLLLLIISHVHPNVTR